MAKYQTQIQWGGPDGGWHDDAELEISIKNRQEVVPPSGNIATGTTVSWSSPNGNATVTFFDNGSWFMGTAQFPDEGPVGYRGQKSE